MLFRSSEEDKSAPPLLWGAPATVFAVALLQPAEKYRDNFSRGGMQMIYPPPEPLIFVVFCFAQVENCAR